MAMIKKVNVNMMQRISHIKKLEAQLQETAVPTVKVIANKTNAQKLMAAFNKKSK